MEGRAGAAAIRFSGRAGLDTCVGEMFPIIAIIALIQLNREFSFNSNLQNALLKKHLTLFQRLLFLENMIV